MYKNLYDVCDTKINVYTEGTGECTIIFMSGSGITSPVFEYKSLYSKLSDSYRIAVVEKPGYGYSGRMTRKRTVKNIVSEYRLALSAADIKPPYILAPHSYSGIEAVWWANTYPNEVKAVLGVDMVFPNMALAQAKEITEYEKQKMLQKHRQRLLKIASGGITAKLLEKYTVNASGLMTSNYLTEDEKKEYKRLFYANLLNDEIKDESVLATDNAVEAHETGVLQCPCCFFISSMKSPVKAITWQEAGIQYAAQCGGEYHLTDQGHQLYTVIPDEMADTFRAFLDEKLKK